MLSMAEAMQQRASPRVLSVRAGPRAPLSSYDGSYDALIHHAIQRWGEAAVAEASIPAITERAVHLPYVHSVRAATQLDRLSFIDAPPRAPLARPALFPGDGAG